MKIIWNPKGDVSRPAVTNVGELHPGKPFAVPPIYEEEARRIVANSDEFSIYNEKPAEPKAAPKKSKPSKKSKK